MMENYCIEILIVLGCKIEIKGFFGWFDETFGY
jgi:hypothetical protein